MKIVFLGGADEIGASCTLFQVDGCNILVDCGIRLNRPAQQAIPEFSLLEDVDHLDAIILTHAHLDHSGALPMIIARYPSTPIYTTIATSRLTQMLLLDAAKIMRDKSMQEGEIPIYEAREIERMLGQIVPVNLEEPVTINKDSNISVRFISAGHILGAISVILTTPDGVVFITGDISITDQRTVVGAALPKIRPHLLICESTYGGKLHASRDLEERRLCEMINEVLQNGGKVLIPAFAVGRAQEVILILKSALIKKQIPETKIYIDGLVRYICDVYVQHPQMLTPYLRRLVTHGIPVFGEPDGPAICVESMEMRNKIVESPDPCVIIASSGMLTGGTSPFYAKALAGDPKNLIAITGYQDEESPGRSLLTLAEKGGGTLSLPGYGNIEVKAKVQKYNLSAHADTEQLLGVVKALKPKNLVLVHGEQEMREELSRRLYGTMWEDQLFLPQKADAFEKNFYKTTTHVTKVPKKRKTKEAQIGFGHGKELNRESLVEMAEFLLGKVPANKVFSTYELAYIWYGREPDKEELSNFAQIIGENPWPFEADIRRPFKYRINPAYFKGGEVQMPERIALAEVDRRLPEEPTGLYDKSVDKEKKQISLQFHFPDIAAKKYKDVIDDLTKFTNWAIVIHPYPNKMKLEEKIAELLPKNWKLKRNPSVYLDQKRIQIIITEDSPFDRQKAQEIQKEYKELTGFELGIVKEQAQKVVKKQIDELEAKLRKWECSDMATAFNIIDLAFKGKPFPPTRKSFKTNEDGTQYIELAFITPKVGERYVDIVEGISKIVGTEVRIKQTYNLIELQKEIQRLLPHQWQLAENISLYRDRNLVVIKLQNHPAQEDIDQFSSKMEEFFGLRIEIKTT
jgi:Cft2 family RNA processing exonuclease